MQSTQIIYGFSDIKIQFSDKCKVKKSVSELILWFSFDSEILYVHDYDDHEISMALAVKKQTSDWITFLKLGSHGDNLVKDTIFTFKDKKFEDPAASLNEQYKEYGYSFRR